MAERTAVGRAVTYAKILTETECYYMTKSSINIGRASQRNERGPREVDVPLPERDRTVSRQHATVALNNDLQCFELFVHGKNGMELNGVMVPSGSRPVQLRSQDVLQAGSSTLWFLLPCSKREGSRKKRRAYAPPSGPRSAATASELAQGKLAVGESRISQRLVSDMPALLGELIANSKARALSYEELLRKIFAMHPNLQDRVWIKSCVRHVLALNDFFEAVSTEEGAVWTLKPQHRARFVTEE